MKELKKEGKKKKKIGIFSKEFKWIEWERRKVTKKREKKENGRKEGK